MKNTVKVALSAIALAALVAAPAVAKSRTQQSAPAQTYTQQGVCTAKITTSAPIRIRASVPRSCATATPPTSKLVRRIAPARAPAWPELFSFLPIPLASAIPRRRFAFQPTIG